MRGERKFWVRRESCWGGVFVYFVAKRDEQTGRTVNASGACSTERIATKLRDRMEADWNRYEQAMWSKPRAAAE
jgi:hypothetical protein